MDREREFARFAQLLVMIAAGIYIGHSLVTDLWDTVSAGVSGVCAVYFLWLLYGWILRWDATDKAVQK